MSHPSLSVSCRVTAVGSVWSARRRTDGGEGWPQAPPRMDLAAVDDLAKITPVPEEMGEQTHAEADAPPLFWPFRRRVPFGRTPAPVERR